MYLGVLINPQISLVKYIFLFFCPYFPTSTRWSPMWTSEELMECLPPKLSQRGIRPDLLHQSPTAQGQRAKAPSPGARPKSTSQAGKQTKNREGKKTFVFLPLNPYSVRCEAVIRLC